MTTVNTVTGEVIETLTESDARRLTDRIRLLAENVAEQVEKMAGLIDQARVASAWMALGYTSWTAYVAEEFAGVLPRLAVEPRREFVRELAATGMSTRAIAPVVGADHSTIVRDLRAGGADAPPATPIRQNPVSDVRASGGQVIGLDGKQYTRPRATDHAALADAAIAEFSDLAYYRDEESDLEHCWRLAEKLRDYRERGELDDRLDTLRKSIDLARSKRDGTYVPTPPTATDTKTCPTCGQEVSD